MVREMDWLGHFEQVLEAVNTRVTSCNEKISKLKEDLEFETAQQNTINKAISDKITWLQENIKEIKKGNTTSGWETWARERGLASGARSTKKRKKRKKQKKRKNKTRRK